MSLWTDEAAAKLHELWRRGVPPLEIGEKLGYSVNAIKNKANRLGLSKRNTTTRYIVGLSMLSSSITRQDVEPERCDRRRSEWSTQDEVVRVTLPDLPMVEVPLHELPPELSAPRDEIPEPPAPSRFQCEELLGESRSYVRCRARQSRGAYCDEHARKNYLPDDQSLPPFVTAGLASWKF